MRRWLLWLAIAPALAVACGGGKQAGTANGADGGGEGSVDEGGIEADGSPDGNTAGGSNVAPMTINAGPAGTESVDVPFISVTLCVPGTDNCQTIDSVTVDTGSTGLRIISSVLSSSLALPQQTATTGSPLAECYQFADGYVWGSVRLADVKIAGEVAAKVPIQLIGDPAFGTVPSDCSSSGPSENTVAAFGSNGLIGINQVVADCGAPCASAANPETGAYYSCSGTTCTAVAVSVAAQVPNPIASFATDNNGSVLEFPTVAAGGAPTLAGSLIFGIGTQSNNALGSASVQTVDPYGNFTTIYKGATFATSFIDSGSNSLSFNDTAIPQCTGGLAGFYCPTSTLSLTAENKGLNGVTTNVSFSVENAETLFGNASYTAFDDLAGSGIDNNSFDWGLPFFIGRSVYVALEGATTPGGKGPYFAY